MQLENASAMDEDALAMRYEAYVEAWQGIPLDILKEATKEWFKTETFFPPANKIIELTKARHGRRLGAYHRLKALVEFEYVKPFESEGTQQDRRRAIEASLGRVGKPLLIPATPADIQALKQGTRNKIFLLNGERWNATTCFAGRPVFLSKGYGKGGLGGVISSFEALPIDELESDDQKTVRSVFGKLKPDSRIAVIGISHLRNIKERING